MNIENINKKTPQVEEQSSQLLVQDSELDIGNKSVSHHGALNNKLDSQSQERISAMNDSYENLNVHKMSELFSKRKTSNAVKNSRIDDKYSPQLKDNASYSSVEKGESMIMPAKSVQNMQTGNVNADNNNNGKFKMYKKHQELEVFNN